ncbi:hypothetical protein Tco_0107865, partial [Tanacetum coccineum]
MTLDHSSSSLGPHCLMNSVHISSGLVLHLDDRSLLHDNIIPKPDLALELDPEPVQEDQTGSNSGKLHVSLAGPNPEHMDDELTEVEEEAVAREVHA